MKIKSQILSELLYSGALTRSQLSKKISFSPANISKAVKALIIEGKIKEVGYKPSGRGRKSILLDVNQSFKFALGIGFADGILSVMLITLKGEALEKATKKCDSFDEALLKRLCDETLRNCGLNPCELLGIGLCTKESDRSDGLIKNLEKDFSSEILFEPAEDYLLSSPYHSVNPEELCLFAAAKVVRDKFINQ